MNQGNNMNYTTYIWCDPHDHENVILGHSVYNSHSKQDIYFGDATFHVDRLIEVFGLTQREMDALVDIWTNEGWSTPVEIDLTARVVLEDSVEYGRRYV